MSTVTVKTNINYLYFMPKKAVFSIINKKEMFSSQKQRSKDGEKKQKVHLLCFLFSTSVKEDAVCLSCLSFRYPAKYF